MPYSMRARWKHNDVNIPIEFYFQIHLKTKKEHSYLGGVSTAEKFLLNYTDVCQRLKLDYFNLAVRHEYIKQKRDFCKPLEKFSNWDVTMNSVHQREEKISLSVRNILCWGPNDIF